MVGFLRARPPIVGMGVAGRVRCTGRRICSILYRRAQGRDGNRLQLDRRCRTGRCRRGSDFHFDMVAAWALPDFELRCRRAIMLTGQAPERNDIGPDAGRRHPFNDGGEPAASSRACGCFPASTASHIERRTASCSDGFELFRPLGLMSYCHREPTAGTAVEDLLPQSISKRARARGIV